MRPLEEERRGSGFTNRRWQPSAQRPGETGQLRALGAQRLGKKCSVLAGRTHGQEEKGCGDSERPELLLVGGGLQFSCPQAWGSSHATQGWCQGPAQEGGHNGHCTPKLGPATTG